MDILEFLGLIPVDDPETLYDLLKWVFTIFGNLMFFFIIWKFILSISGSLSNTRGLR